MFCGTLPPDARLIKRVALLTKVLHFSTTFDERCSGTELASLAITSNISSSSFNHLSIFGSFSLFLNGHVSRGHPHGKGLKVFVCDIRMVSFSRRFHELNANRFLKVSIVSWDENEIVVVVVSVLFLFAEELTTV